MDIDLLSGYQLWQKNKYGNIVDEQGSVFDIPLPGIDDEDINYSIAKIDSNR